jgi:uncharacterized protein (DUF305 family)
MTAHALVFIVSVLAGALGMTASSAATEAPGSRQHVGHGGVAADAFAKAMHDAMTKMATDMEGAAMSGDPDRDFLAMMIPHHAGAVAMARLVLIHGKDPLVRRLAEEIIAGQQAEIEAMRARLAILKRGPDADPGGFPALHGTRGVSPPARPRP